VGSSSILGYSFDDEEGGAASAPATSQRSSSLDWDPTANGKIETTKPCEADGNCGCKLKRWYLSGVIAREQHQQMK